MANWSDIAAAVAAATGAPFALLREHAVGGGCINRAHVLEGAGGRYFVKLNRASGLDMFEAEADGLREILAAQAIRAPRPVCAGTARDTAFLVLEHIELGATGGQASRRLGLELAAMHRHGAPQFGWHRDNTIGSTPQPNRPTADWVEFWRRQRLGYQLELAGRNGAGRPLARRGERLLADLAAFFRDYAPRPALLHGDLWSGNYGVDAAGRPVIFDPAVYFGDREADLAMTELFGGFGRDFYAAYQEAYPLDRGYGVRKNLYNLYHILNHFNLFGGGYGAQAERMIDRLLAELG